MKNLLSLLALVSTVSVWVPANASVTFTYIGKQLYDFPTDTPLDDKVIASITFLPSAFIQYQGQYFGSLQLSDVVSWEVHTNRYSLTSETGSLNSSFPTPPFVVANNEIKYWSVGFGTPFGETPVKSIWLTDRASLYGVGVPSFDSVYDQSFPVFSANSYSAGTWTLVSSAPVPIPAAFWLFGFTLAGLGLGRKRS